LPDDQGGHCDGLRSAFTPSAHFICCRYSAANGTLPPESPPLAAPVDLGQDVAENGLASLGDYFGTGGGGGQESDEGNLVQGAVGAAASLQTADDAPTEPSPLPSNGSPDIEDSSTAAVVTVSDAMYGQVSVAETTGFSGQFTEYATDMSEVVTTTAQSEDEATRLEHSGTASEEGTTATSVTESARQRQHEGPGPLSADASGSKLRPIQSRVGFDGPLLVLTDRGIVEARPSAIRAETEILVHGDDVGHSILELQSRDDASALATFHTSESSGGHADTTTTEAYPAVTASEGSGTPVTASLQSVPEDTAAPATGTTVSSGDTTLLPDISLDLVAGSQRRTSPSVPAPELDNSLLDTATGTAMRTAQDSTPSKREHVVSESASTKDRRVSGEEPTTATEGNKHTPTQILLQLAPGSRSPPAEGESELSKNALQISETSHETPGTIRTEMSVDEVTTPSWEHDGTAETRPEPSLGETVSRPGDCDERGAPTATEADGEGSEPTAVAPQPSAGGAAGQTFAEVTALPSGMETTAAAAEQLHQPRPGAAPPATAVAAEVAVAGASEATALGNASPATQQPAHHSPLCGIATPGRPGGAQCWLVQFVGANSSSSPVCVGSYLDATTIVTSAACISRSEEVCPLVSRGSDTARRFGAGSNGKRSSCFLPSECACETSRCLRTACTHDTIPSRWRNC
jgi:hypothetical protein